MHMISMQQIYLAIPLLPLIAAVIVGVANKALPRGLAHILTILGVAGAFGLSVVVFLDVLKGNVYNGTVYTWMTTGAYSFQVGFLIDKLTAMMMLVVTFVSLMVHIYTIGYMHEDAGYRRFFSYISLFTFSMLMLVMANNFMQLFFGWEAVGLVSYLLIGFWYTKPTAIYANLKAFLVNRVGDFGFLLGIGMVLWCFGSLDYVAAFHEAPRYAHATVDIIPGVHWSTMTVICILLFIGAMGKSAQVPLQDASSCTFAVSASRAFNTSINTFWSSVGFLRMFASFAAISISWALISATGIARAESGCRFLVIFARRFGSSEVG